MSDILSPVVNIVFGADDWAFLELQAEESALEPAQVVAMLIRKARKAYERPAADAPDLARREDQAELERQAQERKIADDMIQRQREIAEKRARLQAELAALDAHMIETPGGKVGGIDQTPLEAWTEIDRAIQADITGLPEFDESLLRQPEPDPIRSAIIPSSAAPGSLTGPVGIRRDLKGGDVMGDARANIIRRNFKHLGAG